MTTRRRKKHRPEEVVAKLRDADAMLNAGKDLALVIPKPWISEIVVWRWTGWWSRLSSVRDAMVPRMPRVVRRLIQRVDRSRVLPDVGRNYSLEGLETLPQHRPTALAFVANEPAVFGLGIGAEDSSWHG
jgi:hypothetical protein